MATAILVLDMLRGFCEEGYPLYCGRPARDIIPNIRRLLEREIAEGGKVFFICDNHAPDDPEFQLFPPHCIAGTPEAEVIPELAGYPGEIITKRRYGGFFGTTLEDKLRSHGIDRLVLCGVWTDICVLYTAADAKNRDYAVEVPVDCVASMDEEAHKFALNHMEKVLGVKLIR